MAGWGPTGGMLEAMRAGPGGTGWYVVVGAGGVAGAAVRWGVGALMGPHELPVATLVVNAVGCLVLGAVVAVRAGGGALDAGRRSRRDVVLDVVGVGVCGGLTTFSTFTVEVVDRLARGRWALGVAYVVVSLAAGAGAFLLGEAVARGHGAHDADGAVVRLGDADPDAAAETEPGGC